MATTRLTKIKKFDGFDIHVLEGLTPDNHKLPRNPVYGTGETLCDIVISGHMTFSFGVELPSLLGGGEFVIKLSVMPGDSVYPISARIKDMIDNNNVVPTYVELGWSEPCKFLCAPIDAGQTYSITTHNLSYGQSIQYIQPGCFIVSGDTTAFTMTDFPSPLPEHIIIIDYDANPQEITCITDQGATFYEFRNTTP